MEILTSQSDAIILYSGSDSDEGTPDNNEIIKYNLFDKNKTNKNYDFKNPHLANSTDFLSKRPIKYLSQTNSSALLNPNSDINHIFEYKPSKSLISDNNHKFLYNFPQNRSNNIVSSNISSESSKNKILRSVRSVDKDNISPSVSLMHSKSKRRERRKRTRVLERYNDLNLNEKRIKQQKILSDFGKLDTSNSKLQSLSFRKRMNELKSNDMILLELQNGIPRLTLDLGSGQVVLLVNTTSSLADNKWHRIDIIWKDNVSKFNLNYLIFKNFRSYLIRYIIYSILYKLKVF